MKLNEFTIDAAKKKDKITHTAHFINTLRNNEYPISIKQHSNNHGNDIDPLTALSWNYHISMKLSPNKYARLFTRKS